MEGISSDDLDNILVVIDKRVLYFGVGLVFLLLWLLSGLFWLVRLLNRLLKILLSAPMRLMSLLSAPLGLLRHLLSGCRGGVGGSSAPPPGRRRGVSPLHDLLEDLPDFFAAEVLTRLDPAD